MSEQMKREVVTVLENYEHDTQQEFRTAVTAMQSVNSTDDDDESPPYDPVGTMSEGHDETALSEQDQDSDDFWLNDTDFEAKIASDEDDEVVQQEDELQGDLSTRSPDSLLAPTWAENTYRKALAVLRRYYTIATGNENDESNDRMMLLFDAWLGLTCNSSSAYFAQILRQECNDIAVWQHAFKCDELQEFAIIAMKLITVAVGESDVERLFSRQRRLIGMTMTNIGPDVLLARLRISTADPETVVNQ